MTVDMVGRVASCLGSRGRCQDGVDMAHSVVDASLWGITVVVVNNLTEDRSCDEVMVHTVGWRWESTMSDGVAVGHFVDVLLEGNPMFVGIEDEGTDGWKVGDVSGGAGSESLLQTSVKVPLELMG